ncbi:Mobile element protein (plasmid) [Sinorhizobium sp. CCBAU 05631]|nr:Mobile element protein [Sinorhizobium sp. CCBAU 05631]
MTKSSSRASKRNPRGNNRAVTTEKALTVAIQEAYIQGISTRSVDDLVKAMGMSGISKSQISRACEEIDGKVKAFPSDRSRATGHTSGSMMRRDGAGGDNELETPFKPADFRPAAGMPPRPWEQWTEGGRAARTGRRRAVA